MEIVGYDLLVSKRTDGIRYAWKCNHVDRYVESAAFINKTKDVDGDVCGYTTSVSGGCVLHAMKVPCAFCKTGMTLPFSRFLSYKEIALQNVFMVLCDMNCSDFPEIRDKKREFAYMGQGEPGYSYSQVRMAIELTNIVMNALNQEVHRHIFATCGIPEAIFSYKNDINNWFTRRVTLHLSVHAYESRGQLLPVNNIHPIDESFEIINGIYDLSGEKPCVGIMLFNNLVLKGQDMCYSTNLESVRKIVNQLDPNKIRLSFCEYNPIEEICSSEEYPSEKADEILSFVRNLGFDAKLFSSFGKKESSACGMLGGKKPDHAVSSKQVELLEYAYELIEKYAPTITCK